MNITDELRDMFADNDIISVSISGKLYDSDMVDGFMEMLETSFDGDLGDIEGTRFFAWSESDVFFMSCHDDEIRLESVPRNPDDCSGGSGYVHNSNGIPERCIMLYDTVLVTAYCDPGGKLKLKMKFKNHTVIISLNVIDACEIRDVAQDFIDMRSLTQRIY